VQRSGGNSSEGAGASIAPAPAGEEVLHRGVRWRRVARGRLSWYNEGLRRWVLWEPGQDAPPLPPGWVPQASSGRAKGGPSAAGGEASLFAGSHPPGPGTPASDAMALRRPMTSPYRLVPVLIALVIVAVAIYQATRPPAPASRQDVKAAEELAGKCLAAASGPGTYSPSPVSCAGAGAKVKVVAVVLPGGRGSCPKGTFVAQVAKPGVIGEPFECLQPLRKRG
jgi:hypothetical protein